jgi:hypothetical protein
VVPQLRELQPVSLSPAPPLRVGAPVVGIASPHGLGHTLLPVRR